jgi:hypothetical protein
MNYIDMPLIIPILAGGYLLTIYVLLILAERIAKGGRYVASENAGSLPYPSTTPMMYVKPPEGRLNEETHPKSYVRQQL